jgi:hypothetical protein
VASVHIKIHVSKSMVKVTLLFLWEKVLTQDVIFRTIDLIGQMFWHKTLSNICILCCYLKSKQYECSSQDACSINFNIMCRLHTWNGLTTYNIQYKICRTWKIRIKDSSFIKHFFQTSVRNNICSLMCITSTTCFGPDQWPSSSDS